MKEIKLTNGYSALVDDSDYDWLSQHKWYLDVGYKLYHPIAKNREYISMHRLIMNPESKEQIDHINGNSLDNRRCNLRIANKSQNGMNSKKYSTKDNIGITSSKYKGVSYHKRDRIWQSYIRYLGKIIHLGNFINEDDAGRAYDVKAKEYFGEYARLNFPTDEVKNEK